ncbi:alkylphosphonate utilization protein [Paracoccus sp. p4-l81]|uniref:alkylphosphonate utilization protein n=1 Tax=unclassified Paracoccus (in: a-proteobacteria) TaxID=2688777 RepID=UPI0035B73E5E
MTLSSELSARSGGYCEFCGSDADLAEADGIAQCATCRTEDAASAHWRCLEGAAWSVEPDVQRAVWLKLSVIDADWARDVLSGMTRPDGLPSDEAAVIHRDSNGAVLEQGDTVTLIKDLPVKGAGFTAKRGTAVRGISLVPDNAAQIEGRVEGQRIVILTEFVKKQK